MQVFVEMEHLVHTLALSVQARAIEYGMLIACTLLAVIGLHVCVTILPHKRLHMSQSVLVTGTGSGIGREIVSQLSRQSDAPLVCWDINSSANNETSAMLRSQESLHIKQTVDTSNDESVESALSSLSTAGALLSGLSSPYALISCAGVVCGKDAQLLTATDVQRTFGVNTIAHWNLLRHALPGMRARGRGVIVLVSSVMGLVGSAQLSDYCASKAATNALADCLRLELQRDGLGCPWWTVFYSFPLLGPLLSSLLGPPSKGIAVVTVCPYAVNTGMFEGILSSPVEPWFIRCLLRPVLFPVLTPPQVAQAVVRAIEAGVDAHITLPAHAYWAALAMRAFLPLRVYDAAVGLLGGWHGMTSFQGRKPPPPPMPRPVDVPGKVHTQGTPKGGRGHAKSKA